MNKNNFKEKYRFIKSLFDEFDPAGSGAIGEYDDLIFEIMVKIENNSDKNNITNLVSGIVGGFLGSGEENVKKSCGIIVDKILEKYPKRGRKSSK